MELKNISFQYGKYRLAGRGRYQPSNSVHFLKSDMVSVAVSLLETTELVFIEPGVKINGAYYRDVLLGQHLLPRFVP